MDKYQKAQQMGRILLLQEILGRRNGQMVENPITERVLNSIEEKYRKNKSQELLLDMAKIMMFRNSQQQTVQMISQRLNLSPVEERALMEIIHLQYGQQTESSTDGTDTSIEGNLSEKERGKTGKPDIGEGTQLDGRKLQENQKTGTSSEDGSDSIGKKQPTGNSTVN